MILQILTDLRLRTTADKGEIKDFPKPSPLSHKRGLKDKKYD